MKKTLVLLMLGLMLLAVVTGCSDTAVVDSGSNVGEGDSAQNVDAEVVDESTGSAVEDEYIELGEMI